MNVTQSRGSHWDARNAVRRFPTTSHALFGKVTTAQFPGRITLLVFYSKNLMSLGVSVAPFVPVERLPLTSQVDSFWFELTF